MSPDSSGEQALLLKNISTEQAVPPEVTTTKQEYKDIKDDISEGSPTRSLDASDGDALLVSKNQGLYFCLESFFVSQTFQHFKIMMCSFFMQCSITSKVSKGYFYVSDLHLVKSNPYVNHNQSRLLSVKLSTITTLLKI